MRTLLSFVLLLAGFSLYAQERCATLDYFDQQKSADPAMVSKIAEAERFLQKQISSSSITARSGAPTIIKIPVVVHILYKNAADNISDAVVKSQIDALNRDFRRTNRDTINTPARFGAVAADAQIEFYLATADPKGRATSGIVRRQTNIANFYNNDKIKFSSQGGDDAWDSKSYLNIWVGRLISGAGYASLPGGDESKDGVVINTGSFGTIGVSGTFNMGRTATHEIGHWLGLKHIWGDAQCGDDGVADTPVQSTYTQDCPTGFRSTCSNGELGDMYMNYMDYTADACMNLFTQGQKARMRAAFNENGPRESLLQSKGLREPWLVEAPMPTENTSVAVYPNPASSELVVNFGYDRVGMTVFIMSANGSVIRQEVIKAAVQKLPLTNLNSGIYFIKGNGFSQKFIKL